MCVQLKNISFALLILKKKVISAYFLIRIVSKITCTQNINSLHLFEKD